MLPRTPLRALSLAVLVLLPLGVLAPVAVADPSDPTPTPSVGADPAASPSVDPSPSVDRPGEPSEPTSGTGPTASGSTSEQPTASASPTPTTSTAPTISTAPSAEPSSAAPTPSAKARVQSRAAASDPIAAKYAAMGGAGGKLGAAKGGEKTLGNGDRYQEYASGVIYWSSARGALEVHGDIYKKWASMGRWGGKLGVPTTDQKSTRGGQISTFASGAVYWRSSTGTREVHGDIYKKWKSMGAEYGTLGVPTTDQKSTRGGQISFFEYGAVYWRSSTGAKEVHGDIYKKWKSKDAEYGRLGIPLTNQYQVGSARVSEFERGWIVWTSRTGAQPVVGTLFTEYRKRKGPAGDLGVPTGAEFRSGGGWRQNFANGRLDLNSGTIYTRVKLNTSIRTATASDVKYTYRSGCPVGPSKLKVVTMNYLGYDKRIHRGVMILRSDAVSRTVKAFDHGSWRSFPIYQMKNPDTWKADDPTQMKANNTSAFNCRKVVGNPYAMSPHSYGRAVDINTVQNPYYDGSKWWPSNGTTWIKKRSGTGVLTGKDPMTKGMTGNGYFWGGWWAARDWQHFEIR